MNLNDCQIGWIGIGILLIIAILFMSQIFLRILTQGICKIKCENDGAIYFKRIPDRNWFSSRDYCICLYNDKTYEKFRLN